LTPTVSKQQQIVQKRRLDRGAVEFVPFALVGNVFDWTADASTTCSRLAAPRRRGPGQFDRAVDAMRLPCPIWLRVFSLWPAAASKRLLSARRATKKGKAIERLPHGAGMLGKTG